MPVEHNEKSASSQAPKHDQGNKNRAALLILDMINCFDFDGGDKLKSRALKATGAIQKLRREVESLGWPTVFVNDNFGQWHSDSSILVETAIRKGSEVAKILRPDEADYFIIKPQFSGFYSTNLAVLLPKLGVSRLILTGVSADICVLFTAADAHMRDYDLWIPSDAVAGESSERCRWALEIMANAMGARTDCTQTLTVSMWISK